MRGGNKRPSLYPAVPGSRGSSRCRAPRCAA